MPSYVVIGASRGIGLEYVRQLAARPDSIVFATVRSAKSSTYLASAVSALKNVHILEADVANYASLERAAKQTASVTGGSLDYFIHNAARTDGTIMHDFDTFSTMDELDEDFIVSRQYKANALGFIHSVQAFLPLLRAGSTKRVIVIGTAGSLPLFIRNVGMNNMVAYSMTKAAQHIAAVKWSVKLQPEGFTIVTLSPGIVDTVETGDPAERPAVVALSERLIKAGFSAFNLQTPTESVNAQLNVIDGLTVADSGKFFHHNGEEFPM